MVVREPKLEPVRILDLRPTQITVGFREVKAKREYWRRKDSKKEAEFLGTHMIPVVLGPKKRPYVIECHVDYVLKGPLTVEGDSVFFHYTSIVGPPVHFRAEVQVTEKNVMRYSRYQDAGGKWEKQFSLTYERSE